MKTFRYVYGITLNLLLLKHADRTLQHKALFTTEGQRVALMNFGSLTEIRGDSINSGHRWSEKQKLSTWMGTSKKNLPMRFDDGLCECRHSGRTPHPDHQLTVSEWPDQSDIACYGPEDGPRGPS